MNKLRYQKTEDTKFDQQKFSERNIFHFIHFTKISFCHCFIKKFFLKKTRLKIAIYGKVLVSTIQHIRD